MTKIKNKERLLNEAWKKQWITYKGTPIRLSKDFTEETLRPEERDTFKTMKGNNNNNNKKYICIAKNTLHSKALFQILWRDKSFTDKQTLKKFTNTKSALTKG